MAAELSSSLPVRTSKQADLHPLAPLTADEIRAAASIVQSQWPTGSDLHYKTITLEEPAKAETVPFLEAEHSGKQLTTINRRALVTYYLRRTVGIVQWSSPRDLANM
ncbi:hypothetical protein KC318_g14652 [Hortaea werneckii]|nr:hypothetical protein KC334_g8353 [Hortaea werneckii]KAI6954329.1 hypothetical protein KC355_g13584 [Hortaea werneckii]KAI7652829.1 hypothetical protein KC318_g14652 [Hortaea werneckii]